MKGVVFNVFEEFISESWGEEAYEALLDACPLHSGGVFAGPSTYPDADLVALLTKACEKFDVPVDEALRAFGRFMFPQLAQKFPVFLENQANAKEFLKSVHDVIHVEVRKLFQDAVTPSFSYEDTESSGLLIKYSSARQLCFLMEGMLDAVGKHYETTIQHTQKSCMHSGDDCCRFELKFAA